MHTILITNGTLATDADLLFSKLKQACHAGIDAIQLREKNVDTNTLIAFAERLRKITADCKVHLFINGRLDVALKVGADGVHFPENAVSPQLIAQAKENKLIVGGSTHSLEAAEKAKGADFLIFSPIFNTGSKQGQGLDHLKSFTGKVQQPVYALGGIKPEHIPDLLKAGAKGVAAITSFLDAPNIPQAVHCFNSHFSPKMKK